jgi:hypothetical protein
MLYNADTMFEETKVPDPGSTGWVPLKENISQYISILHVSAVYGFLFIPESMFNG